MRALGDCGKGRLTSQASTFLFNAVCAIIGSRSLGSFKPGNLERQLFSVLRDLYGEDADL